MSTILVGNGPSILNKKRGYEIDQFDVVVRFNTFYTKTFESFTGTKTTIWAVNLGYIAMPENKGIQWLSETPRPKTIVFVPYTLKLYPCYEQVKSMPFPPNTELCSEKTAKEADTFYNENTWASTGLMAILEFQPCTIIGFDCFSDQRHHYIDDNAKNTYHIPEKERQFVNDMKEKNLVIEL